MERNGMLYTTDFIKHALAAITLMIAESLPADKEFMVNLVVRLVAGIEQ